MTRVARVFYWTAPMALCLALYWLGLKSWFSEDDFAWLGLRNQVTDLHSFLWAMFAPLAQGTIRPLSERGFFMLFSCLFGLHALPYHIWVFLNQFAGIVLLMLVTRKLTQSDLAGFVAPILWLSCVGLVTPLGWAAAYNEVQCASFLLLSFFLFLRYTETGRRGFYWAMWATFILGFGSNEINVVFPALAALYAILTARRFFLSTLPMFAVSVLYSVVHQLARHDPSDYYYDMDFHIRSLIGTFWQYWRLLLLGVPTYADYRQWHLWSGNLAVVTFSSVLVLFAAWQAYRRIFAPLFFLAWFFIVIGPLLPLHNHVTDYYLFIPALGIAMLAAHAFAAAAKRIWTAPIAVALAALYMYPSIVQGHRGTVAVFERAERSRALVESVAYAKHVHPGKMILLDNVDDELYWSTVYDSPFRIFGWNDVYMTPECLTLIKPDPHFGPIDPYVLPATAVAHAVKNGDALVYEIENRKLRNITRTYAAIVRAQPDPPLASFIDVGVPHFESQIGEGWYGVENGFRWSTQHAIVYLPGPSSPGQKLTVHGSAPDVQTKKGPLHFALSIDGRQQPVKTIGRDNADFHFDYDLPADLVGRPKVEVAFTLDRTVRVSTDDRNLGIVFGEFSVK